MTTNKDQSSKILNLGTQKCTHFAEKFSNGARVQDGVLPGLRIYLCDYTQRANFEIHLPTKSYCNFT